jgi:hypothetical protein
MGGVISDGYQNTTGFGLKKSLPVVRYEWEGSALSTEKL